MKQVFNINQGWLFSKTLPSDFGSRITEAEKINLPHTWNYVDASGKKADHYRGKCVYQKDLPVPSELEKICIYLEFYGVNNVCELYIDGKLVGVHKGGGATFRFEITPFITFGKTNIISVAVDNSYDSSIYPLSEDNFLFGGIYRDVNLIITGLTHFALDNYGAGGVYVIPRLSKKGGMVGITAEIENPINYDIVSYTVYDYNGSIVGSTAVHPKKPDAVIHIEKPELWQGRLNPYLYKLKAKLLRDGEVLDSEQLSFGFRSIDVRADTGFFLNDIRLNLRGVTRHQDMADVGIAMSYEEQLADIKLLKEMGANAVRLPFSQDNKAFYDLCDKEGIIVWTQLPVISNVSTDPLAKQNIEQQTLEMLKQCYNHPSICFFGVHSDIQNSESSEDIFNELSAINRSLKRLDKRLLSISANSIDTPVESRINDISDLVGYNIYLGWDYGKAKDFTAWAENFALKCPYKPLAISEYGAEGLISLHNDSPQQGDYSEEYQCSYHEEMLSQIKNFSFIWSSFASSMFDYALAEKNKKTDSYLSHSGLVSYDRKTKKDAFYFYKSQWSHQKFVYVASRRYAIRTERKLTIKVYSNCKNVSLTINGREYRPLKQAGIAGVFLFDVRLSRGENKVRAVSDEGIADELILIRQKTAHFSYSLNENHANLDDTINNNVYKEKEAVSDEGNPLIYGAEDIGETLKNIDDKNSYEGSSFLETEDNFDYLKQEDEKAIEDVEDKNAMAETEEALEKTQTEVTADEVRADKVTADEVRAEKARLIDEIEEDLSAEISRTLNPTELDDKISVDKENFILQINFDDAYEEKSESGEDFEDFGN